MESKPGGWIDILAVGFSILRTRLVVRSISRDHANDHSARGVPEHLLALAGIDRFRTDVYGAARRPSAVYSRSNQPGRRDSFHSKAVYTRDSRSSWNT